MTRAARIRGAALAPAALAALALAAALLALAPAALADAAGQAQRAFSVEIGAGGQMQGDLSGFLSIADARPGQSATSAVSVANASGRWQSLGFSVEPDDADAAAWFALSVARGGETLFEGPLDAASAADVCEVGADGAELDFTISLKADAPDAAQGASAALSCTLYAVEGDEIAAAGDADAADAAVSKQLAAAGSPLPKAAFPGTGDAAFPAAVAAALALAAAAAVALAVLARRRRR